MQQAIAPVVTARDDLAVVVSVLERGLSVEPQRLEQERIEGGSAAGLLTDESDPNRRVFARPAARAT